MYVVLCAIACVSVCVPKRVCARVSATVYIGIRGLINNYLDCYHSNRDRERSVKLLGTD